MTAGKKLGLVALAALGAGPALFYGLYNLFPILLDRFGVEPVLFGGVAVFFVASMSWLLFTLSVDSSKEEMQ